MTEQDVERYWDQLCLRHHDAIMRDAGWDVADPFEKQEDRVAYYLEKRAALLGQMDVFHVEDAMSHVRLGEVVVVNLDVITAHRRIEYNAAHGRPDRPIP